MTKEEKTKNFIEKAKQIHGDYCDYSQSSYPLTNGKIKIICPVHGEFWQVPSDHFRAKHPCPQCGGRITLTKESFIKRANEIHNYKYNYDKVGEIKKVKDKVIITCPIHGDFEQEVNSHLQGRGCPKCAGKKFDLESYIQKANLVWNNKYDYSKFEWKGISKKVCIICPEHGEFWQLPNNHLKGECGCLECRGKSKEFKLLDSLEELKRRSIEKYGDKFDFSKAEWKGSRTPITIICPEHGEFQTLPRQFLLNKFGCPKCNNNNLKYTTEEFIELCKKSHPNKNYDYSKVVYTHSNDKITVICPIHGEFYPVASQFLSGQNDCPKCVIDSYRLGTEEFIRRAKEIHGDYYDYSKTEYINFNTKVKIICPKHGEFETTPGNHLKGCNCPKCARENMIPSKGEELIKNILNKHNIKYIFQKDLTINSIARNSNQIIVDFLVKYNNHLYIIEYNGKQHYEYIPFFHSGGIIDFEKQKRRDNLLRKICEDNKDKLTLIEIKYDMKNEDIEPYILNILGI